MSAPVITVKGISKRYRVGAKEASHDSLFQSVLHSMKAPFRSYQKLKQLTNFTEADETVFWALKDINFEVKQGEVLGIIGHNGAGKSTLLKILSRITEPTSGEVQLKGRVSALLEVGTGFHPDLTGRDNVYMNGTILGMTKREINSRFDEIIEFSGVEKHIDTPVKFYSSGMKVRLGFAVAAHLEPEILIVDEVLSVGDIGFQRKCLGKMNEVASSGRTVLFVSHNMAAVENLCTAGCLLDHGEMSIQGNVD
ncbi:MAG: ABC transporter ATP-binding protein, partial [Cyclobacteriaceae bacterium]|nr:ABC transporter ATP-binding protein [Cyclobacteriaceae bacterium]